MNAKLTDANVFVLVTALLNKMDHPDTATVRSEVEILINHLDSAPNLDPTEDAALFPARPAAKDRSKFLIADAGALVAKDGRMTKASKPQAAAKSDAVAKKATARKMAPQWAFRILLRPDY